MASQPKSILKRRDPAAAPVASNKSVSFSDDVHQESHSYRRTREFRRASRSYSPGVHAATGRRGFLDTSRMHIQLDRAYPRRNYGPDGDEADNATPTTGNRSPAGRTTNDTSSTDSRTNTTQTNYVVCMYCAIEVSSLDALADHLRSAHPLDQNGQVTGVTHGMLHGEGHVAPASGTSTAPQPTFDCMFCGIAFITFDELDVHMTHAHPADEDEANMSIQPPPANNITSRGSGGSGGRGRTSRGRSSVRARENPVTRWSCQFCTSQFRSTAEREAHENYVHADTDDED